LCLLAPSTKLPSYATVTVVPLGFRGAAEKHADLSPVHFHSWAGLANIRYTGTFPWHAAFTAVNRYFISFALPASVYNEEYVYIIHTHLTA